MYSKNVNCKRKKQNNVEMIFIIRMKIISSNFYKTIEQYFYKKINNFLCLLISEITKNI